MTKALFFDIDGTLVSFKTHSIPASTIEALEKAHAKGVKIFISTGRPTLFINNLQAIEHLIDGYMTANGGYCYIGDRSVSLHPIAKDDVLEHEDILQITPFFTVEQEAEVMPHLHSVTSARWYPDFTDITASKADKGQGLLSMAAAENIAIADTMAFGDGGNDIAILRQAGIGVAMGNANDDVKAVANYVTSSVDDDGIANALKHFGVI